MKLGKLILTVILFISGCSNMGMVGKNGYSEQDVYSIQTEEVDISNDFELLKKSAEIASADAPFSFAMGFIPDNEFIQYEDVQGEKFLYLKLSKDKTSLTGQLVYENNTDENVEIQAIFLQGNTNVKIRPINKDIWKTAIKYEIASRTSVRIPIEIDWDPKGMQELSVIPLNKTSTHHRYDGNGLGSYRFFVQNKDKEIDSHILAEQSFELNEEDLTNEIDLFPIPSWMGVESFEPKFTIQDDELLMLEKIKGLRIAPIPYNTYIDILWIDEFGNTELLANNIQVNKKQSVEINIEKKILDEMYRNKGRQFLLVVTNREEKILSDIKALAKNQKPFSTNYQGIIEFYKAKEN